MVYCARLFWFWKKVAAAILDKAKTKNIEAAFSEIIVPTEEVVEVKKGKKRNAERKFFPGYVLTKMEMTDETYHMVKALPKVSGFLVIHKVSPPRFLKAI